MAKESIEYFEDLVATGTTCPPEDAFVSDGNKKYYRVVKHNPATSKCFLPAVLKKNKYKPNACIAKSVSIYDNVDGLINAYFKTPAHKKKQNFIGVLTLSPKDGKLKKTFRAGHHSWWRSKAFVPVSVSIKMVEA